MKNPFKSTTIWGLLITVAAKALYTFLESQGIQIPYETIVELIGLIIALFGRWKADTPLSFSGREK